MSTTDRVTRAMTGDLGFRVITADTTETVRAALGSRSLNNAEAKVFGELLTAVILSQQTLSPEWRVQAILQTVDGLGQWIADSHPSGRIRGSIRRSQAETELCLTAGAPLRVMRTLPDGSMRQGIVAVPESGELVDGFSGYLQASEDITSVMDLQTSLAEDGSVVRAGGYLVQLLPEATSDALRSMTERMEAFPTVKSLLEKTEFDANWLLGQLLQGWEHHRLYEGPVRFGCWCDEARVMAALATLPAAEIENLLNDEPSLTLNCDFCGKPYQIGRAQLKGLLSSS